MFTSRVSLSSSISIASLLSMWSLLGLIFCSLKLCEEFGRFYNSLQLCVFVPMEDDDKNKQDECYNH